MLIQSSLAALSMMNAILSILTYSSVVHKLFLSILVLEFLSAVSIPVDSLGTQPTSSINTQVYLFSMKCVSEPAVLSTSSVNDGGYDGRIPDISVPTNDSLGYYHASKPVRRLWKWKDAVLGDGRDFFVPKPRTLSALQKYIIDHCPTLSSDGNECVILSNCARFEIIVACQDKTTTSTSSTETGNQISFQEQLANEISHCLSVQMDHYLEKQTMKQGWKELWMAGTSSLLNNASDRPQDVLTTRAPSFHNSDSPAPIPFAYWNVVVGSESVLPYLCRIAAGMATRPRRPGRPVLFRPFSSRDAHILLQLKRTRESSLTTDSHAISEVKRQKQKRIALLLEYALRAGKAARNPKIVPELERLRSEYKPSLSSPENANDMKRIPRVADVAYHKAIVPLIQEYLEKERLSTSNLAKEISELRRTCLALIHEDNREELQWMSQKLHGLTLELRTQGRFISYNSPKDCVKGIEKDLKTFQLMKKLPPSQKL